MITYTARWAAAPRGNYLLDADKCDMTKKL